MDTQELVKDIKARFNINFQKEQLKEKYTAKLIVANQGGLWKVTPELITFVNDCGTEYLVLIDEYQNPVKVKKEELLPVLVDTYLDVMEEWYNEFEKLKNNR